METRSPEYDFSGDNVWGLTDEFLGKSFGNNFIMLNMKHGDMPCDVCKDRNETLAKREDLAWQREGMIHAREKRLRERELLLDEKYNKLCEEQTRLKHEEERILKLERKYSYSSEENKNCSSFDMKDNASFALQQSDNIRSDFLLNKEKLLQEKEKVISEKAKNIEIQEQKLLKTEQLLNEKKTVADQERQLADERNVSIANREQIVKDLENVLNEKLNVVSAKMKSFDDRESFLVQKENTLTDAVEIITMRECALNERENSIIVREKNIMKQIYDFVSKSKSDGNDHPVERQEAEFTYFVKVINDKLPSLQQRENAVSQSELILEEKWKKYFKAQELLKLQENEISAIKSTCENEKLMLSKWAKVLEKKDNEISEKLNLFETTIEEKSDPNLLMDDNKLYAFDLPVSKEMETSARKLMSPINTLGGEFVLCPIAHGQKPPAKEESMPLNALVDSKHNEISGDEFLQFLEKEKEELQHKLLSKETVKVAMEKLNESSEKESAENSESVTAQASIDKLLSNETENAQMKCFLPELNDETRNVSPTNTSGSSRKMDDTFEEQPKNNSISVNSEKFDKVYCGDMPAHKDSSSLMRQLASGLPDRLVIENCPSVYGSVEDENLLNQKVASLEENVNEKLNINKESVKTGNCFPLCGSIENVNLPNQKDISLEETANGKLKINEKSVEIENCHPVCGHMENETLTNQATSAEETVNEKLKVNMENVKTKNCSSVLESVMGNGSSSACSKIDEKRSNHEDIVPSFKNDAGILPSSKLANVSSDSPPNSPRSRTSSSSSSSHSTLAVRRQKKPARNSLLHAITSKNYVEAMRLLGMNCMPLELRDETGRSAILLAVGGGNTELVERLIEEGADIRACDYQGYSALHVAVLENNCDMVDLLLRRGLCPQVTDNNGDTALNLASQLSDTSVVDIMNRFTSMKSF